MHVAGLRETSNLGLYLGVPLTRKSPKAGEYQHLVDKLKGKLTMWKSRQISMARRVTLSKAILEAIPTYSMMSDMVPKSCLKEI